MISVIVPVYKVESFLSRCIESIINQTYTDIEIILIDDGSPDRCGEICDEYALKDVRIKVIHKKNGGLSDARNAGIAAAAGELITFVDSDDYIAPNMIGHLWDKMEQYGADISICSFQSIYDDATGHGVDAVEDHDVVMSGVEAMKALFLEKSYAPITTWCKLYKTTLFTQTGVCFPVGRIHEDRFTTYKMFFHSQQVIYSNRKLYFYYRRSDSIMGRFFRTQRLDDIEAAKQAIEFVNANNLPLAEEAQYSYISVVLSYIDTIIETPHWRRKWFVTLEDIRETLCNTIPRPLSNRYLWRNKRIKLTLLLLGYWCYVPAKKLYMKTVLPFSKKRIH